MAAFSFSAAQTVVAGITRLLGNPQSSRSSTRSSEPNGRYRSSDTDLAVRLRFLAWPLLIVVGAFSTIMNILTLGSIFFILIVFKWVIPHRDVRLLIVLIAIVMIIYLLSGLVRLIRTRTLRRFADEVERFYEPAAIRAVSEAVHGGQVKETGTPLQDLAQIRSFTLEGGLVALFDVPWLVLFVGVMAYLNPLLAILTVSFTLLIAILTIVAQKLAKRTPDFDAQALTHLRTITLGDGGERALALTTRFEERWLETRQQGRHALRNGKWLPDVLLSLARTVGDVQGIAVLALAAYLTLENITNFGVIIVSRILAGRILRFTRALLSGWPHIVAARKAWPRLKGLSPVVTSGASCCLAERSSGDLVVDGLCGETPGQDQQPLSPVSFTLRPGEILGVMGPSGAGKSALANILAGRWRPASGNAWIAGVNRFELSDDEALGLIGYLPQQLRFFDGSFAENISRFSRDLDEELLLDAVKRTGLCEFGAKLESGWNTQMTSARRILPAGIRQRVGLARAIYGHPLLLILDDPTAWLDPEGERCLADILKTHKEQSRIAIICTNQQSFLMQSDLILLLGSNHAPVLDVPDRIFEKTLDAIPAG
jgi:ATP-binding cassette subfamily C protein EexD